MIDTTGQPERCCVHALNQSQDPYLFTTRLPTEVLQARSMPWLLFYCPLGQFWAVFVVWQNIMFYWKGDTAIWECCHYKGVYLVCYSVWLNLKNTRTQSFSGEHWIVTTWSVLWNSPVSHLNVVADHCTDKHCLHTYHPELCRSLTSVLILWGRVCVQKGEISNNPVTVPSQWPELTVLMC